MVDHSSTTSELKKKSGKFKHPFTINPENGLKKHNPFSTIILQVKPLTDYNGRFVELVYNPRNGLERALSRAWRFIMPYLAFVTYRVHVEKAREMGNASICFDS